MTLKDTLLERNIQRDTLSNDFDHYKRRFNDTATWLSEVLHGNMRTSFEYTFDGHELYADDGGELGPIFEESIKDAENLPPYEHRRRLYEKDEYSEMLMMAKGEMPNTMIVVSDFPPELMSASRDVGGYNVSRKQTMLRVITKTNDNKLKISSQSLDLSDRIALENMYKSLGFSTKDGELLRQRIHIELDSFRQEFIIDELTGIYDRSLAHRFGGEWYAGIKDGSRKNTYDFVSSQQDLINAYLAKTDTFSGSIDEYNLAAAMKLRYEGKSQAQVINYSFASPIGHLSALHEMQEAGSKAEADNESFNGCGFTVGAQSNASKQLGGVGYGNILDKEETDKYGVMKFRCPKKWCRYLNKRKRNRLLDKCQGCNSEIPKC